MTATSDNAELLAHYEAKIKRLAKVNGQLLKAAELAHEGLHKLIGGDIEGDHPGLPGALEKIDAAITAAKEAAQ